MRRARQRSTRDDPPMPRTALSHGLLLPLYELGEGRGCGLDERLAPSSSGCFANLPSETTFSLQMSVFPSEQIERCRVLARPISQFHEEQADICERPVIMAFVRARIEPIDVAARPVRHGAPRPPRSRITSGASTLRGPHQRRRLAAGAKARRFALRWEVLASSGGKPARDLDTPARARASLTARPGGVGRSTTRRHDGPPARRRRSGFTRNGRSPLRDDRVGSEDSHFKPHHRASGGTARRACSTRSEGCSSTRERRGE